MTGVELAHKNFKALLNLLKDLKKNVNIMNREMKSLKIKDQIIFIVEKIQSLLKKNSLGGTAEEKISEPEQEQQKLSKLKHEGKRN